MELAGAGTGYMLDGGKYYPVASGVASTGTVSLTAYSGFQACVSADMAYCGVRDYAYLFVP